MNVNEPAQYESLEVVPILEVLPISEREMVVFANYTDLVAYGKEGLRWRSKRISWDGFSITARNSEFVEGQVWNPRVEANTDFRVALADGKTELA